MIGLASRKVEVLLVYLACTGRPHSREALAELLWKGRSQEWAPGNLRVALTSLRKHLGDHVTITRQTVALEPEEGILVDALEFEGLVTEQLEAALERYRGEFLAGAYLRDAPDLELSGSKGRFSMLVKTAASRTRGPKRGVISRPCIPRQPRPACWARGG